MSRGIRVMTLEEMLAVVEKYHTPENAALVERAWHVAEKMHEGQKRKSGEPYFIHPVAVASTLAAQMMDGATIAAGLLHDCVEDNAACTVETIQRDFGAEVASLVDGVTKLTRLTTRDEQQAESLRKMILAMSKDIRVVLIKLADRLHNMLTLKYQSPERQVPIARETLEIYAPLAHRLGVYSIKSQLEDLSFMYLEPEKYRGLAKMVGMKRTEREDSLKIVQEKLESEIKEMGIEATIDGRPKHFFSIYRKMELQNIPFEQIYDLIAIRVIVRTIPDCYAVLGLVHTLWRQVPNRFKDYISIPKANMYQSLHTTVVGQNGQPFEVQIRTYEMHRLAEFGIAAHWRYKEGRQVGDALDEKLYWLRQILDWQSDARDAREFVDLLKVDLFTDEVFVFTPKGDIISLPRGATPLDFAYRIHTAIGNKCIGAKVNRRIVTLDTELNTGDFVEILTSSAAKGPSRDWMKIVKTTQAKTKIRQWFKKELKTEHIELGRDMLEHEAQRNALAFSSLNKPEYYEPLMRRYSLIDLDDVYSAVGFGSLSAISVIARLSEEQRRHEKPPAPPPESAETHTAEENEKRQQQATSHGVTLAGDGGMLVRYAQCCNPVPGEAIVGYITRGRGVTIHRANCVNALHSEPERLVEVDWNPMPSDKAVIHIVAYDRKGLLADISDVMSSMDVPNVSSVSARANDDGTALITMELRTRGIAHLDKIIKTLTRRPEIIEAYRV